jgi:hypothetical protein
MSTKTAIHDLTLAEINRQIKNHVERQQQIRVERAAIYANLQKNGTGGDSVVLDGDEREAREIAKRLLNGSAPAYLAAPPNVSRDRSLAREYRALEIVVKILTDSEIVARAAEAVVWAEANADRWRALCRDVTLAATRLEALESSARDLIDQCGDISAVRLPMANIIGSRTVTETPLIDLQNAAIAEGVVMRWSRLSEQILRVDKWSVCRG